MTTCIFSIFSVLLSFFEWASFDKQRQERAIFCAVGLLLSSDPYGPVEDWAYFQIIPLWSVKYFKDEFFLKVWNKVPIYVVSSCFDSGFCSGSSPQSPQCFFHFNLGDFWENWELIESNVQLVSCRTSVKLFCRVSIQRSEENGWLEFCRRPVGLLWAWFLDGARCNLYLFVFSDAPAHSFHGSVHQKGLIPAIFHTHLFLRAQLRLLVTSLCTFFLFPWRNVREQ